MKVYALVGKSGTGKSFQATRLCGKLGVEYIIDDGLLIGGSAVIAGISAKRQKTKIGAIKTALFTDETHRKTVREALHHIVPESVLVLGTSDRMIEIICDRLSLPSPEQTIYIEEITTEKERRIADQQRHEQGKHVIPVPAPQLKQDFSGYFMNPLRFFRKHEGKRGEGPTVVRPTYGYLGEYHISDRVIVDIVSYLCSNSDAVIRTVRVGVRKTDGGRKIALAVILHAQDDIFSAVERIQREIVKRVETMTAFRIEAVDVEIRGLRW